MKLKSKLLSLGLVLVILLSLSGCGCKKTNPRQYRLDLEIWGFDDEDEVLQPIFDNYVKSNPNVRQITYKKLTVPTYKSEIIDALAAGQGPDIFLVHNDWLPSFGDKIVPAPDNLFIEQQYRSAFVDVAANDFVDSGKIYAAPLSVDSLGLYYNKDLFNEAGITSPPKTWEDFLQSVRKLTKINASGQIYQSGASLGTSSANINRATDVLNMLFMQRGFEMPQSGAYNPDISAGENTLDFYMQFANSSSSNYSWNSSKHYSIDAFSEGNLAMMFNYSWHVKTIMAKSPKLNFAVAPVPQIPGNAQMNYANYWAFAVAKNKTIINSANSPVPYTNDNRIYEAWKFLVYLTTKPNQAAASSGSQLGGGYDPNFDPAVAYVSATKKPSARRDIIESQKVDPIYGSFSQGNLIAKSWRQRNPDNIEAALNDMINSINLGQANIHDALAIAIQRIRISQE